MRLFAHSGLVLAVLLLAAGPVNAAPACRPAELVTGFGDWSEQDIEITAQAPVQPASPRTQDNMPAVTLRLLMAVSSPGTAPWTLSLYDALGHLVGMFDKTAFTGPGATLWTGRLPGPTLTLALTGGDAATKVVVRGGVAQKFSTDGTAFSLKNPPIAEWSTLYPVRDSSGVISGSIPDAVRRTAGDKVGMMIASADFPAGVVNGVRLQAERESWCCTGVMIGKDLFLTNWHCGGGIRGRTAWDSDVRAGALVDLAWENGPIRRQFSASNIAFKDERLDFAILRIKPSVGADGGFGGALPVAIRPGAPVAGTKLFMIHHAQCAPKMISSNCTIIKASRAAWTDDPATATDLPDIEHDCDSEPGASGAAVFDLSGRLVALHHLGHARGPSCPADAVNKAVGIGAIMALVRIRDPALATELGW